MATPKYYDPANTKMYVLYVRSGKTMRQIARECQISLSAVSKIVDGKRRPSVETAVDLARSLGVTVEEVIEAAGMKWGRAKWQLGYRPEEEAA